ncbi:MAG: hypothetical protein LBP32_00935, partial [Spirochaetaceae bacterium]|nr:hypothetical protein [Spirochaetaceae bacterium]
MVSPVMMVLTLMTVVVSLHAGGKKDGDISRADQLIDEKNYNDAILILTDHTKENPESFDRAQRRFRRIIRRRDEFNVLAGVLLDVLAEDPGNVEEILSLIDQLDAMEAAQNPTTQAFLKRTRDLAQFTYNRSRLEQILVKGRALLDAGDYVGAINTYAGGMDIYRDDFFKSGYGELVEARVSGGINDINDTVGAFIALNEPVAAAVAAIPRETGGNTPELSRFRESFQGLRPHWEALTALNDVFVTTGRYFENQLAVLRESDDSLGDRSFLSFASRLLHGRPNETVQEGMIGAVTGLWISSMSRFEDTLAAVIDRMYGDAYTSAVNGNYQDARSRFAVLTDYIGLPMAGDGEGGRFGETGVVRRRFFFALPDPGEK